MRLLRRAGKEAQIWNFHPTPGTYRSLPDSAGIHVGAEPPAGFPAAFDCAVVLECPTLDRTGLEARLARLPLVNIDHHLGNALYGVANWVDTTAPAVGVMVAALARAARHRGRSAVRRLPAAGAGQRHRRLPLLERHAGRLRGRGDAGPRRGARPSRSRNG